MNNNNLRNVVGKEILIVGMGKSGLAAAEAMVKLGAKVYIQDSKAERDVPVNIQGFLNNLNIKCYFNETPRDIENFDIMILSPGVSPEVPFVVEAREKGVEIIGELEIAYRVGQGNYIGITGTNGKTTTTTLVGEIFKTSGRKTHVVGNIGVAVISASINAEPSDWLVTETSSFQLETIKYFAPKVSAILNLTPDHLNRHHTIKAYGEAKSNVFLNQEKGDYLVINYDDKDCYKLAKKCKGTVIPFSRTKKLKLGAYIENDKIVIADEKGNVVEICSLNDIRIIGDHNLENVLAAAAISYFAGVEVENIKNGIVNFNGVEHRIEYCGEIEGVKYYNDSKGTNVDASVTAIKALKKDIILIAGGDGKAQEFSDLVNHFKGSVKTLILLGRDGHLIGEAAEKVGFTNIVTKANMDECVAEAYRIGEKGDNVLLSPACASWDMYVNYEQRGEHFKLCVDRLLR